MSETSSNIKKAYDEWAEIYDTDNNRTRDLNAQTLREESLSLAGKRVLEIGCGTGLNTEYLVRHASVVTGMDISGNMLARARRRVGDQKARFVAGDITKPWSFENASFDVIVGNLVLEHIEVLSHVFREAYRVLDAGGKLYIAELHPYRQLRQSQARYISKETGKEVLVDAFTHPVSEYVNDALEAGFNLRQMEERKHGEDDIPRLLTLLFEKP